MKKILLPILTMFAFQTWAQTNLNFETWSGNEPQGWFSSNSLTSSNGGAQTVFRETSNPIEGNSSLKLVTGACPDCPDFLPNQTFGLIDCSLPNPFGGTVELTSLQESGVPYTLRPLSVDFKYKSIPQNGDAAGFHMELTRYNPVSGESETVGEAYFETNSTVNNWTQINVPMVYYSNLTPDTMNIFIASSIGSIMDCSSSMFIPGMPSPYNDWGLPYPQTGSEFHIDEIVINLPSCASLSATTSGTNETSFGAADGTAAVNVTGGTAPYTYLWNTLETTSSIANLAPGAYFVTVTDANQCQKTVSYVVSPAGCNINVSMSGNNSSTSSIHSGNGSVTATVSGGNGPYEFVWNNGTEEVQTSTSSINSLPVGSYAVLVVEQNNPNCAVWGHYTVLGPGGATSIKEDVLELFTVYPNPAKDFLKVNITEQGLVEYRIIDTFGKVHKSGQILNSEEYISLEKLKTGTYLVEMNIKGHLSSKVLIIE